MKYIFKPLIKNKLSLALSTIIALLFFFPVICDHAFAIRGHLDPGAYTFDAASGKYIIPPGSTIRFYCYHEWLSYSSATVVFTNGINTYPVSGTNPSGQGGDFQVTITPAPGDNYYYYLPGGYVDYGPDRYFLVGYPDGVPPDNESLSCTGTASSLNVTLTGTADDTVGVTLCCMFEDTAAGPSYPPPSATWYAPTKIAGNTWQRSITLNASKNAGTKYFYAWFKDAAGNLSARASTTYNITDGVPPAGSFTISQPAGSVTSYFNSPTLNMTLTASDIVSDVTQYCIRNFPTTSSVAAPASGDSDWKNFNSTVPQQSHSSYVASHILTGGDGSQEVCVWYKDAAGNIGMASGSPRSVFLDTKAPKGSGTEVSTVTTLAGGLTVQNVAADASGNVYVVGGGSIKKITPSGAVTTITSSLDSYISGIALDKINNLLYTCGHTSFTPIRKITMTGVVTVLNGNGSGYYDAPLPSAMFMIPYGCAVDNSGNVYLGDSWNNRVRLITFSTGMVSTYAGTGVYGPTYNNTNQGAFADGDRITQAMFFSPGYVTVDKDYNVFVADSFNHRIRRINYATGYVNTYAGNGSPGYTDASIGTSATFFHPGSLTVDNFGNVFVLSCTSGYTVCAVRKIAPDTSVSTYAGAATPGTQDGPALSARFGSLTGITSDDAGNVYVADSGNNSVRKISTPIAPPELIINNGAKITKTLNFKMQIFGTDKRNPPDYPSGVAGYFIKCNDTITPLIGDSAWLAMPAAFDNDNPTTQEVDFSLPAGTLDGLKTFYLWFKDKAGNVSSAAQKSIKLDRMLPVEPIAGSLSILGPQPELQLTREVLLQLNAESGQDAGNGYYDILVTDYFINDCNKGTTPTVPTPNSSGWKTISPPRTPFGDQVPYTITGSGDGTKEIRVWYKDVAGNMSDSSECETFLDTSIPNGGMTINSNAEWSNSPLVTLNLNATNTTGMNGYFISTSSLTPAPSDTGWHPVSPPVANYTANVPYSLGRSAGVKTVYVWYKSTSGIVSAVSSDTIKLDYMAPKPGLRKWQYLGMPGLPDGVGYNSLFIYNKIPYLAHNNGSNGNKGNVLQYNKSNNNWSQVGGQYFSLNGSIYIDLFISNGHFFVSFQDLSPGLGNKLTVMKFDGNAWNTIGSPGISSGSALSSYVTLINGIPYVAYSDLVSGNTKLSVKKFISGSWASVGSTFLTSGTIGNLSMSKYGEDLYLAFQDMSVSGKLSVLKVNDNGSTYVGGTPGITAPGAKYPSISVYNGTPYLAFQNPALSDKASVLKFDGNSWSYVGTPGLSSDKANIISLCVAESIPYIAFQDISVSQKATVMSFNGEQWKVIANPGISPGLVGNMSLYVDNDTPYIAFQDYTNSYKSTVMKYDIDQSISILDINSGEKYTNSKTIQLNLAATDDYSGVAEYYAAESPEPPDASTTWNSVTLSAGGTAEVNFTLSTVTKPVTVYVWFRDAAGNISPYTSAIVNPRSMKAIESYGNSSTFNRPFLIARDSSENLIVADMPAVNTSPLFKLLAGAVPRYSAGSRIITPGSAIDALREVVSGLVVFPGDYVGLIEDAKKRFAIFNAAGTFVNGFAKSVDMVANFHGFNTISGARGVIFDKYNAAGGSVNPFAEARVMANQASAMALDLNFAAAAIEIFTDATYATPAGQAVSSKATLYIRVRGAGGDPNAVNSIMMKAKSSGDPKGIAVQLIETSTSSDIFTGTLVLGQHTDLAAGALGAGPGTMIYLGAYSKTGILNRTVRTKPKPPSGPTFIADLGGGVFIEMVRIPAGTFVMGQTGISTPTHEVTISKDFYMSKYEITQGQWLKVMGALASSDKPLVSQSNTYNYGKGENYPVYWVSWDDICNNGGNDFMTQINSMGLVDGTFGLPTEAEWEYACRAGTTGTYYWGEDASEATVKQYCWYGPNANSGFPWTNPHAAVQGSQIVGQKLPNAFGLYDMSGNVHEWCSDWYGAYTSAAVTDPAGPASGTGRVHRGGSWSYAAGNCRSTGRGNDGPSYRYYYGGFRLVLPAGQ